MNLRWLRRNKRKCAKCGQWRQSLDVFSGKDMFTGDWCWRCISKRQSWILEQVGIILAIRVQGRDDFDDVALSIDRLIRSMPKKSEKRDILWDALEVAVNCEVQEGDEQRYQFCTCDPRDSNTCPWCDELACDAMSEARLAWD